MALFYRLNHIIHLTQQINKQYWLVIQILQSMHLLFVEELHLVGSDNLVVVQVNDAEPILQTPAAGLVLLGQHEPYKVLITHLVLVS